MDAEPNDHLPSGTEDADHAEVNQIVAIVKHRCPELSVVDAARIDAALRQDRDSVPLSVFDPVIDALAEVEDRMAELEARAKAA